MACSLQRRGMPGRRRRRGWRRPAVAPAPTAGTPSILTGNVAAHRLQAARPGHPLTERWICEHMIQVGELRKNRRHEEWSTPRRAQASFQELEEIIGEEST